MPDNNIFTRDREQEGISSASGFGDPGGFDPELEDPELVALETIEEQNQGLFVALGCGLAFVSLVFLGVIGFAGYKIFGGPKTPQAASSASQRPSPPSIDSTSEPNLVAAAQLATPKPAPLAFADIPLPLQAELFRQLQMAQIAARQHGNRELLNRHNSRIAEHYNVEEEALLDIRLEGVAKGWPGPRRGEKFLPPREEDKPKAPAAEEPPEQANEEELPLIEDEPMVAEAEAESSRATESAQAPESSVAASEGSRIGAPAQPAAIKPEPTSTPRTIEIADGTTFRAHEEIAIHWQYTFRDEEEKLKSLRIVPEGSIVTVLSIDKERYYVEVFQVEGPSLGRGWVTPAALTTPTLELLEGPVGAVYRGLARKG